MRTEAVSRAMKDASLDTRLKLVADRRRRLVIDQLRHEVDGEASFDRLLDRCWQAADADQLDRSQFAVELFHNDLPKLAAHGVVEFDPESRRVRYCPNPDVENVLDSLPAEPALRK